MTKMDTNRETNNSKGKNKKRNNGRTFRVTCWTLHLDQQRFCRLFPWRVQRVRFLRNRKHFSQCFSIPFRLHLHYQSKQTPLTLDTFRLTFVPFFHPINCSLSATSHMWIEILSRDNVHRVILYPGWFTLPEFLNFVVTQYRFTWIRFTTYIWLGSSVVEYPPWKGNKFHPKTALKLILLALGWEACIANITVNLI